MNRKVPFEVTCAGDKSSLHKWTADKLIENVSLVQNRELVKWTGRYVVQLNILPA